MQNETLTQSPSHNPSSENNSWFDATYMYIRMLKMSLHYTHPIFVVVSLIECGR